MNVHRLAVEELDLCFGEWGVDKDLEKHIRFRKRIFSECRDMMNVKVGTEEIMIFKHLKKQSSPPSVVEAYKLMLKNELQSLETKQHLYVLGDALSTNAGFGNPWCRYFSKNSNSPKFARFKLRNEYQRFRDCDLDPLRRFSFHLREPSAFSFSRWFTEDKHSAAGVLMESHLACYSLQHSSCFSCKASKSLRWNAGDDTSWKDMVCISCNSTFEIKSKASMEKVEKAFKYNNIPGGSFQRFWRLKNCPKKPQQKMFLVVVSRDFTMLRSGAKGHPVYCAEIDTALPKIHEGTCNEQSQGTSLGSSVSVKLATKQLWFNLPQMPHINMDEIKEQIFKAYFGEDKFLELHNINETAHDGKGNIDFPAPPLNGEVNAELADLQRELEEMQVDDWDEDNVSEDES